MNNGMNTTRWLEKTLSNGVVFVPGEFFYCNEPDQTTLRMSFVTPTDEQLIEAVRRLKNRCKDLRITVVLPLCAIRVQGGTGRNRPWRSPCLNF